MNKIKKVSKIFRLLFQIAFVIAPCLLVVSWINAPHDLDWSWLAGQSITKESGFAYNTIPASIKILILHKLSVSTKIYGFLISLIPTSMRLTIIYFLIKLFKCYEQGEIFSSKNVKYIRVIAYAMLIEQALNPIYEGLLSLALTWGNPPGHRVATISLDGANIAVILIAVLIILISWIMAEGYKLHEDQTYTV